MRRLILRRLRADDGLSLVETVVGLLVFALIMTGLAGSMTLFAHNTALTKVRNAATSLAQQLVEQARGAGYKDLATCTGAGVPTTAPFRGSGSFTVATSAAAGCLPYQQTNVSGSGYKYSVTELVLVNSYSTNTTSGQPMTEKYLVVQLSWSKPSSGSYELDTVVNNNPKITASDPQGLQIDPQDSSGTQITTTLLNFDFWVKDAAGVDAWNPAPDQTEEGGMPLLSVGPGTYTCIIENNDSSSTQYVPGSNPGMTVDTDPVTGNDRISGTCQITNGHITDWVTIWTALTDCPSSTKYGTVLVTVTDQKGKAVSGATVTLANANGHASPGAATTNAQGVATFSKNVLGDLYTYSIQKTGYTAALNLGPVCVSANGTTSASGSITATTSTCPAVGAKGTVTVTVIDVNGNPVGGAKTVLTNSAGKALGSVNTDNTTGVATYNNNVPGDAYTFTVTKANYINATGGPVCVAAGVTTNIPVVLYAAGSNGCPQTSTKGTFAILVTNQSGTPISGVTVTVKDNTAGASTALPKTNGSGTAQINVPGDTYTWTLSTLPAGYLDPGTQGPLCVLANKTTSATTVLTGVMTVKVAVKNSDTQPAKNYLVTITDSGGNASSQSISVTRTKTGTVTFPSIPTDTYSVQICVPSTINNNCDLIYSSTQNFTAINTTYTVNVTDAKGGS